MRAGTGYIRLFSSARSPGSSFSNVGYGDKDFSSLDTTPNELLLRTN